MLTIQELEKEVTRLSQEELRQFRVWFEGFDAQIWDDQFEADARSGKLDRLANKAIKEFESGKYNEI